MDELSRELEALGREIAYPPTPDLAAAVGSRLRSRPAPSARRRATWLPARRWVLVAVAVAIVLVASSVVLAASPTIRHKVLEALGLRGATVEHTTAPPPKPHRRELDLGRRVTLADASRLADFRPLVPRVAGGFLAVRFDPGLPGGQISILYPPGRRLPRTRTTGLGLLVSEFRGAPSDEYLTKIVPQATTVKRLRIQGHRAVWIAGAPHYFFYRAPGIGLGDAPLKVAQNVLLLQRGPRLLRFEGAFSLRRARAIARSVR
jgi:hypothetical protein